MELAKALTCVALALLIAGCGGGNTCSKACKRIALCAGDAGVSASACTLSAQCSPQERCEAKCIINASCSALTGQDQAGVQDLQSCIQTCAQSIPGDSGIIGDSAFDPDQQSPGVDGVVCTPQCEARQCGPDGCGGTCGTCTPPQVCDSNGLCSSSCTPACSGKQCGLDGCGGTCGACAGTQQCNAQGQCVQEAVSSGEVCTQQNLCANTSETCLFMDQAQTKGMCTTAGCDPVGGTCVTPDPSSQLSVCAQDTQNNTFCIWLCELNGQAYPCPNTTDFECIELDAQTKYCKPLL